MGTELVSISPGNFKLIGVSSVSLMPVKDCGNCVRCKTDCYALKSVRQYPNVREAWGKNSRLANKNPELYFERIEAFLTKKKPLFFRWHVGGDILNQAYLNRMKEIAGKNGGTKFLAYSKMETLDFTGLPVNMKVLFSRWSGDIAPGLSAGLLPRAWYQDGSENRIPQGTKDCPGKCGPKHCTACWDGEEVVFHKH